MGQIYWKNGEFKWWIMLLCAYHFFPFITTRGSILMYVWAYCIPVAYIVWNLNTLKKVISALVYSEAMVTVVLIGLLSCVSILIPVLYGTNDFSFLTQSIMTMIKIIIRMLFISMVIVKNIPNATKETIMKYFIFSCLLYICSTVIMLIVPGIKNIFFDLVKENEWSKTCAMDPRYKTRYGWAGFSGFEYTFKCVLAMIFNNYFVGDNIKDKNVWIRIGVTLVLFVGTLFYGRSGSLFGMLVIVALAVNLLKSRPKILISLACGGCFALVLLLVLQSRIEALNVWFEWAFDLFVTFFKTGKLETGSSNVLIQSMIFMPELKTILLGDGMYTTASGYYMSTDAGIMRPLLFGGIGFAALRYLSLYCMLCLAILKNKDKKEKEVYFWTLLLCVFLEIKGEILFSCLPIIILPVIFENYQKRRKNDGTRFEF